MQRSFRNAFYSSVFCSYDFLFRHSTTYRGVGFGIDKLINAKVGWRATNGWGYMNLSDAMEALNLSIFGNPNDADVISYSFGGGQTNGDSAFEHFIDAIVYESR